MIFFIFSIREDKNYYYVTLEIQFCRNVKKNFTFFTRFIR